ncbi:uncharacterized protein LOC136063328 [Quercus suber]|uniref:uncharacterized protein LOC136063328 n=1 Tax=Quercus suber TaxID=58331 RepID=UPI0032DEEB24
MTQCCVQDPQTQAQLLRSVQIQASLDETNTIDVIHDLPRPKPRNRESKDLRTRHHALTKPSVAPPTRCRSSRISEKIMEHAPLLRSYTEIAHFSHKHDLNLTDKVQNSQKCNGCSRAIVPPFYSCAKCSFFLHKSCANLPKKKRHPLHQHPLILVPMKSKRCYFDLDVQCSLISEILVHKSHEHQLILSSTTYQQNCTSCNSKSNQIFRSTVCEFALDFKCATLPYTTSYRQHEHPLTLTYAVEDDSNEYYCDICEEERDPKHWFYYCENCSYPAHPNCIFGMYTNIRSGDVFPSNCHSHPLTFIVETEDGPQCHSCGDPCREFILQCALCNFYIHDKCLWK